MRHFMFIVASVATLMSISACTVGPEDTDESVTFVFANNASRVVYVSLYYYSSIDAALNNEKTSVVDFGLVSEQVEMIDLACSEAAAIRFSAELSMGIGFDAPVVWSDYVYSIIGDYECEGTFSIEFEDDGDFEYHLLD